MSLLKKISITVLVLGLIVFLVYKGLVTVDSSRQQEEERMEKLAAGTCIFDVLPLDHLLIKGFAKPLKFRMSVDSMKYIDPEERDITYGDSGENMYMTSLKILHGEGIKFLSAEQVVLDPSWSLSEFSDKYHQSYSCRDQSGGSLALSTYMTIENSDKESPLKSILLFFGPDEKLKNVSVDFAPEEKDELTSSRM